MKLIYNLLFLLCVTLFFSCQEKQELTEENVGYLRLQIGANTALGTKAEEVYNPKQLTVKILNSAGKVEWETDDWSKEESQSIKLPTGKYTVQASSAGFDGKSSAFDKPYYAGAQEDVLVEKDKETSVKLTCTLANVKVTVNFDDSFEVAFKSAAVTIGGIANSAEALNFKMGEVSKSAYYPVTNLYAKVAVANKSGISHSQTDTIKNVKARDHYIFNYSVAASGSGSISIDVDESTRTYTFHFAVDPTPKTNLSASANAWSKFAYLNGKTVSASEELDPELMSFQYRLESSGEDSEWTKIAATAKDNNFEGKIGGLTPNTSYQYRLIYGDEQFVSPIYTFTTENNTALHNGNFDLWTTGSSDGAKTIYPGSSEEAGNKTCFWNTSNPGTSQGLGATGGAVNPTTGVSSPVNTSGGQAAQLKSTNKLSVFAAASLYTGSFLGLSGMSANMEFGKPFTSRPISLHGYYKYTPQVINHLDRKPEGVEIIKNQTMDQCAIFIALATKSFSFNNKKEDQYIDYENDPAIIAYGELPSGGATSGEGYTEFTIPLKYKDLTTKPTHIIIVCSASKYGDYMTGGEGSTLYLDDFELVYDGEPTMWE